MPLPVPRSSLNGTMSTCKKKTYTTTFPVSMTTSVLFILKAVVRKQQKVNPAITLSVKAKIVFNLERNVFIFPKPAVICCTSVLMAAQCKV